MRGAESDLAFIYDDDTCDRGFLAELKFREIVESRAVEQLDHRAAEMLAAYAVGKARRLIRRGDLLDISLDIVELADDDGRVIREKRVGDGDVRTEKRIIVAPYLSGDFVVEFFVDGGCGAVLRSACKNYGRGHGEISQCFHGVSC